MLVATEDESNITYKLRTENKGILVSEIDFPNASALCNQSVYLGHKVSYKLTVSVNGLVVFKDEYYDIDSLEDGVTAAEIAVENFIEGDSI